MKNYYCDIWKIFKYFFWFPVRITIVLYEKIFFSHFFLYIRKFHETKFDAFNPNKPRINTAYAKFSTKFLMRVRERFYWKSKASELYPGGVQQVKLDLSRQLQWKGCIFIVIGRWYMWYEKLWYWDLLVIMKCFISR